MLRLIKRDNLIKALLITIALVISFACFTVALAEEKKGSEVQSGSYGVIYYVGDRTKGSEYIVSMPINSNQDAQNALHALLDYGHGDREDFRGNAVHVVLNHDWTTTDFIHNMYYPVQINLNGHTWTVNEAKDPLYDENIVYDLTEGKDAYYDMSVSNGTITFNNIHYTPFWMLDNCKLSIYNVCFKDCSIGSIPDYNKAHAYGLITMALPSSTATESGREKVSPASIHLKNVTFDNVSSVYDSSCLVVGWHGAKDIVIEDCVFKNCHSDGDGGAVYVAREDCELRFKDCQFINCSAEGDGGFLYADEDGNNYFFEDCTAFRCHSDGDGGFVFVNGNYNYFYGGGKVSSDASRYDNRCLVSNCYALGDGGAIYSSNDSGNGNNCQYWGFNFYCCTAGLDEHDESALAKEDPNSWGGAMCLRGYANTVHFCDFCENYAGAYGGAIYIGDENYTVEYCTFEKNYCCDIDGVEIYINDDDCKIKNCKVYSNYKNEYAIFQNNAASLSNVDFNYKYSYPGSGTESDPYIISDGYAMNWLLFMIKHEGNDYNGKYFKLARNIGSVAYCSVYRRDSFFRGRFDGNGKNIDAYLHSDYRFTSLFGYLNEAIVQNLSVSGYISGSWYVGAISSYAFNSEMLNCHNSAYIESDLYEYETGGLTAYADSTNFTNCSNSGTIRSSSQYTGGLFGHGENCNIFHSRNDGNIICNSYGLAITAYSNYTGGLAGYAHNVFTIDSCVNNASVTGSGSLGGIVGCADRECELTNCMNTSNGYIYSDRGAAGGLVGICGSDNLYLQFGNCANYAYTDGPMAGGIFGYGKGNIFAENCFNGGIVKNYNNSGALTHKGSSGTFTNCYYVSSDVTDDRGTMLSGSDCSKKLARLLNDYKNSVESTPVYSFGVHMYDVNRAEKWKDWKIDGGVYNGYANINIDDVKIIKLVGDGTIYRPYVISNAEALSYISDEIENGNTFEGKYFLLQRDTVYTGTAPIGSNKYPFKGIFDGDGHTISVKIEGNENAGLFGTISEATIQNLTVEGTVYGNNRSRGGGAGDLNYFGCGGIAGIANYSSIYNCTNRAAISALANNAGGIVGIAKSSIIDGCDNTAEVVSIVSGAHAGGICGKSEENTVVSMCTNSASVTSNESSAGGIVGMICDNTIIKNCVNYINGIVTASYGAGGIVGETGSYRIKYVLNCANHAAINAPFFAGGILGWDISYAGYHQEPAPEEPKTSEPEYDPFSYKYDTIDPGSDPSIIIYDPGSISDPGIDPGGTYYPYIEDPSRTQSQEKYITIYDPAVFIENCFTSGKVSQNNTWGIITSGRSHSDFTNCCYLNSANLNSDGSYATDSHGTGISTTNCKNKKTLYNNMNNYITDNGKTDFASWEPGSAGNTGMFVSVVITKGEHTIKSAAQAGSVFADSDPSVIGFFCAISVLGLAAAVIVKKAKSK